jgi:hypothetical protein
MTSMSLILQQLQCTEDAAETLQLLDLLEEAIMQDIKANLQSLPIALLVGVATTAARPLLQQRMVQVCRHTCLH